MIRQKHDKKKKYEARERQKTLKKKLAVMAQKTKSWTKYSKDMAATIIQRRYRKYYNLKLGLDDQGASNYDLWDQDKVINFRRESKVFPQRKRSKRSLELNNQPGSNTARTNDQNTDRVMLEDYSSRGSLVKKGIPKSPMKQLTRVNDNNSSVAEISETSDKK